MRLGVVEFLIRGEVCSEVGLSYVNLGMVRCGLVSLVEVGRHEKKECESMLSERDSTIYFQIKPSFIICKSR